MHDQATARHRGELPDTSPRPSLHEKQARRRPLSNDLVKLRFVLRARPFAISFAVAPIHAAATVAGTVFTEQVLERRP